MYLIKNFEYFSGSLLRRWQDAIHLAPNGGSWKLSLGN
jgi:hypothetical protein